MKAGKANRHGENAGREGAAPLQTGREGAAPLRIDALHFLRTLCLLLVALDHIGVRYGAVLDHIEGPAFFIMSGMLFKPRQSWGRFGRHTLQRLVRPYFVYTFWMIVLVLAERWISRESIHIAADMPERVKWTVLGWWTLDTLNYPLWMLKAFVWCYVLYRPLCGLCRRSLPWACGLFVAGALVGALLGATWVTLPRWALVTGLVQGVQGLPLMIAGGILMPYYMKWRVSKVWWHWALCGVLLLALAWTGTPGMTHIVSGDLGRTEALPVMFYARAVVAFCGVLALVELLPRVRPMEWLSRHSIGFLGVHAIAIEAVCFLVAFFS